MDDHPLDRLRARFHQRCLEDMGKLKVLLGQGAEGRHEPLRLIAHGLAGLAGSFGYHSISAVAERIDRDLTLGKPVSDGRIAQLVEALEDAGRIAPSVGAN